MSATLSRASKRRRRSVQAADRDTAGTLVVFSNPAMTFDIGRARRTHVELGGRLWEVEVDDEDKSTLRLSVRTASDDSKEALREVLASRCHEALEREKEAEAMGGDIERLMGRAREVCRVVGVSV
jgi:hypothetical protein